MPNIVIIGIDGFDPFVLDSLRNDLPHLSSLYNDVSEIIIESTFPPDSICAWASIFTGENPAEHGMIESIDYLSVRRVDTSGKRSYLQGRTFWDLAGKMDKRVCVINPFIAYPAWEVNGIMVSGPVFEGGETTAYPEDILKRYKFPPLGGMVDFPEKNGLPDFIERTASLTEELGRVALEIYRDQMPDLFFLTFLTLDRIKHFLWRYTDEGDRYYPGENSFKNAIKRFYVLFDRIVGDFMHNLYEDTVLLIISDHGHRRRCTKSLNLNEILRRKGYIKTSGGIKSLIERAKVSTLNILSRYDLEDWIYRIAKVVPNRKALKKSTYLIKESTTSVKLSNLCGANPYGGIDVSGDDQKEYEQLRERLVRELESVNDEYGGDIIKWIKKREDVYRGKNEHKLPDLLFELDEDYGIGWDFYTSPVTDNYTHKKISGGHKREGLVITNTHNLGQRPLNIIDFKDYILKILGN